MVVVRGTLLVMAKPYSSVVDLSLNLNACFVADPDEGEVTGVAEKTVSGRPTCLKHLNHQNYSLLMSAVIY